MQSALQNPEKPEKEERRSPVTLIIGGVVALSILLSLWFLFHVPLSGPASLSKHGKSEDDGGGAGLPQEYPL